MTTLQRRVEARKITPPPSFTSDVGDALHIGLRQMFPRATAPANRDIVDLVQQLSADGNSVAVAELMLETVERAGVAGWFAARVKLYRSIDPQQLRARAAGSYR